MPRLAISRYMQSTLADLGLHATCAAEGSWSIYCVSAFTSPHEAVPPNCLCPLPRRLDARVLLPPPVLDPFSRLRSVWQEAAAAGAVLKLQHITSPIQNARVVKVRATLTSRAGASSAVQDLSEWKEMRALSRLFMSSSKMCACVHAFARELVPGSLPIVPGHSCAFRSIAFSHILQRPMPVHEAIGMPFGYVL